MIAIIGDDSGRRDCVTLDEAHDDDFFMETKTQWMRMSILILICW